MRYAIFGAGSPGTVPGGAHAITDRIIEVIKRVQGGQLKTEAGNIRPFADLLQGGFP